MAGLAIPPVMAGLVPAIHAVALCPAWPGSRRRRGVDGRDKPGYDAGITRFIKSRTE
jgi:hypothetical protein